MMHGTCVNCGYEEPIPLSENAKLLGSPAFARSVIRAVARASGVWVKVIVSKTKKTRAVNARAAVVCILRKYTQLTQTECGAFLGDRDHSSISNTESRHVPRPEVQSVVRRALIDLEIST